MNAELSRRYGRLLRVYPSGARREELLDTLMERAGPDRRRPGIRESLNLLRHGARARLGRPGSAAIVVFAVLVTLACGLLGAAGAARLSWEAARPLPSGAEADQLKATVFPGLTVWGGGDAALFVKPNDNEGIQYGYADYWVNHTPATRDVPTFALGVRDRLHAAGWQIRSDIVADLVPGGDGELRAQREKFTRRFWATRDGLALAFSDDYRPDHAAGDSDGAALFHLSRTEPSWVGAATVLGGLLGALIGWLLTGWVSRRTEHRTQASALAGVTSGLALLCLLPAMLLLGIGLLFGLVGQRTADQEQPMAPFWGLLIDFYLGPVKVAGFLGLVVLGVAAWPRVRRLLPALRRREPVQPRPWRTRVVPVVIPLTLVALLWAGGWGRADGWIRAAESIWPGQSRCTPTAPPAQPDPGATRLSRTAQVFVSTSSTPDQVTLVQSAIMRVAAATGLRLNRDPLAPEFQTTYCGDAQLPAAVGQRLPWYFTVWLTSPGAFPALMAEVATLPGVVAVQRASRDDW